MDSILDVSFCNIFPPHRRPVPLCKLHFVDPVSSLGEQEHDEVAGFYQVQKQLEEEQF